MDLLPEAKFKHGQIVMTKDVAEAMRLSPTFKEFVVKALAKYFLCNWGDTCAEDWHHNDRAVRDGERILAVYDFSRTGLSPTLKGRKKIWIITEWDRSATTVLFPDEY